MKDCGNSKQRSPSFPIVAFVVSGEPGTAEQLAADRAAKEVAAEPAQLAAEPEERAAERQRGEGFGLLLGFRHIERLSDLRQALHGDLRRFGASNIHPGSSRFQELQLHGRTFLLCLVEVY